MQKKASNTEPITKALLFCLGSATIGGKLTTMLGVEGADGTCEVGSSGATVTGTREIGGSMASVTPWV